MRERMKKKKNIIIGGLLAVVFLMSVGYAAFASNLNITSTASTTNSWNILITNISSTSAGSATDTTVNKTPNSLTANISAELVSPGDKVTYEITVANQGSLNAKLETVTMTESNNEAVIFTKKGIEQGSVLNSNSTAVLIVTIEYNPEVTEQPSNLNASTAITFNYVQSTEEYDELYTVEYMSYSDESTETRLKVSEKQVHFDEKGLHISPEDINLVYTGYSFVRWKTTAAVLGGVKVESDTTYNDLVKGDKSTKKQTLYAMWNKISYRVSYRSQGGSGVGVKMKYWTDDNFAPSQTRKGYTFLGWYTLPNGEGLKVENTTKLNEVYEYVYGLGKDKLAQEITLYANWQENDYTIKYNTHGGSQVASKIVKYTQQGLNASASTKEGHTFDGWYTEENGGGTKITDNTYCYQIAASDTEITLHAKWIEN